MRGPAWLIIALRLLRGALISAAVVACLAIAVAIIAWDSDLYELRDRYERAKLALLGDWSSEQWCPPGRVSEDCAATSTFEEALSEAYDFTFFRQAEIAQTGHVVQTGIRFATARDVISGTPVAMWCYVQLADGPISTQIDLATKSAYDAPSYASLLSLDESVLAGSGLSREMLLRVARSHCQFNR